MIFYLKAGFYSLFSMNFYSEILRNKKVSSFKFIAIISLLVSIFFAYQIKLNLQTAFGYNSNILNKDEYVAAISSQIPEISYKDNKFSFDTSNLTHVTTINNYNEGFLIIDPNSEIPLEGKPNKLIISPEKLTYKHNNQPTLIFKPEEIYKSFLPYFIQTKNNTYKFKSSEFFAAIAEFFEVSYLVFFIFSFFTNFFKYLVWVFLISNISYMLFAKMFKSFEIPYGLPFKLSTFTITPVAIFELARLTLGLQEVFMYPILISLIIHIFYIYFILNKLMMKNS